MDHEGVATFFYTLSFLVFINLASAATSYESQTETYSVTVSYWQTSCRSYACRRRCSGWRRRCYRCYYTSTCTCCASSVYYRSETRTRCKKNWTGPLCNIPICDPPCAKGRTCHSDHTCKCLTTAGTTCKAEPCQDGRSCYPGTCSNNNCICPPQFTGTNCETMLETPDISNCKVKLFTGSPEVEVGAANCAVEGHSPEVVWVKANSFSRVEATWNARNLYPYEAVPPATTLHIKDARFGIIETMASVNITPTGERSIVPGRGLACKANGFENPNEYVPCNSRTEWSEFGRSTLSDHSIIEVTVSGALGGFKKSHTDVVEKITGKDSVRRKAQFQVDSFPPFHCRFNDTKCPDPTISVDFDTRQKAETFFNFTNWYDAESGIKSYYVEIFELLKSSSSGETKLNRPQISKHREEITNTNTFQYTFPAPGVYSVELTVFDYANNSVKARKIIFYDNENRISATKEPLMVKQASNETGYRWITTEPRVQDGKSRLDLSWKGRYHNRKHVEEGWLSRVDGWNQNDGYDDILENTGNRTIHEMENSNGTAAYKLAFKVDKQGGYDLRPIGFGENLNFTGNEELNESTWVMLQSDRTEQVLVMPPLTSSDTIVIWMQAHDAIGHIFEERILVRFDSSPPEIDSGTPVALKENHPDPYHSKIFVNAKDLQSGISHVQYHFFDASLKQKFSNNSANAERYQPAQSENRLQGSLPVCASGDSSCYCIKGGECFGSFIVIEIDHCHIDRYYADDKAIEFHYIVFNQAGQSNRASKPYPVKFQGGKPVCRSGPVFTAGIVLVIVIGLLILLVLIVLVIFMTLRWKQNKHPIPDKVRSFASSMRQRVTNTEKVLNSDGRVIYRSKTRRVKGTADYDDDDIYVDGTDPGGWRIKGDQVEMAETLAEGKFAIVKKAYLKKGGETKTVAAKYLPTGASESDKALLKAKIAFHGNRVPPHDNIVRLIGVLDDGPVMLLEFCDLTLKEWLSKIDKVNEDVLENMLNFTMHIASGMDFLHSKSIVHTRLAMRNILLKKDGLNGLVAKLIGFGTFSDAGPEDDAAESATNMAVPLKWLAIETLETVGKGKPVYTQKSDVWSYGVTIWEIYSLGATPYSGKKSAEVESLLKTGYRMPCPNECSPDLFGTVVTPCWNVNPKKRPDFKTILKHIRTFRSGGEHQQEGYYTANPTKKTYDNPQERTSDYVAAKRAPSSLYQNFDDTRK